MRERNIKAVIFDFDGTLTPLTLDFSHLRVQILAMAGEYVDGDTLRSLDHPYIIETIYAVEEKVGTRGREFRERAFERLQDLELEAALGKDVFPFTRDVLAKLKRRGIRTGIITRSCTAVLRKVFSDMDGYVDGFVTREHIREVKPHPAQAIEMARRLSVAPAEVMLVGDHPTDVTAGNAAGMVSVGVLSGRTETGAFRAAGAAHIFDDIRGLLHADLFR